MKIADLTGWAKGVLIALFAVMLVFTVCEGVARVLWSKGLIRLDNFGVMRNYMKESDDNYLSFALSPDMSVMSKSYQGESFEIATNQDGLRDFDYPFEKKKGTFRIVALGDSITFGLAVPAEDTFPKLLEKRLNDGLADGKYEVINAGCPGYNTFFERTFYERHMRKYAPDLILIGYCLNDGKDSQYCYAFARGGGTNSLIPLPGIVRKVLRRSVFYRHMANRVNIFRTLLRTWIGMRVHKKAGGPQPQNSPSAGSAEDKPLQIYGSYENLKFLFSMGHSGDAWDYMEQKELPQWAELARRDKVAVVFVIFPVFFSLDHYELGHIHEKLKNALEKEGLYALDLLPYYQNKREEDISDDCCHPNREGNHIASEAIYEFLIQKKLIPSRS